MARQRLVSAALAAAWLTLPGACSAEAPPKEPAPEERIAERAELPELGLMGTIPIYWGEADNFGGVVTGEAAPHWARGQIEARYRIRPLDVLDRESLAGLDFLLLAQPRALGAAENVALDAWVRAGGHLLLFADPMLTGESRYALGDRRRPQDVILLSPILTHWGLALEFELDQALGVTLLDAGRAKIPVNLPGRFAAGAGASQCAISAHEVLARCSIGSGQVVVLADAALLDLHPSDAAAPDALEWLMHESLAKSGK